MMIMESRTNGGLRSQNGQMALPKLNYLDDDNGEHDQ